MFLYHYAMERSVVHTQPQGLERAIGLDLSKIQPEQMQELAEVLGFNFFKLMSVWVWYPLRPFGVLSGAASKATTEKGFFHEIEAKLNEGIEKEKIDATQKDVTLRAVHEKYDAVLQSEEFKTVLAGRISQAILPFFNYYNDFKGDLEGRNLIYQYCKRHKIITLTFDTVEEFQDAYTAAPLRFVDLAKSKKHIVLGCGQFSREMYCRKSEDKIQNIFGGAVLEELDTVSGPCGECNLDHREVITVSLDPLENPDILADANSEVFWSWFAPESVEVIDSEMGHLPLKTHAWVERVVNADTIFMIDGAPVTKEVFFEKRV